MSHCEFGGILVHKGFNNLIEIDNFNLTNPFKFFKKLLSGNFGKAYKNPKTPLKSSDPSVHY
ncbi:hypothetical protein JCM31826_13750 [Thermaurantimonas aggregans]|uniref:Uncharacterized protein n=1 Tax=Thermaurantimonas aggregans TaxID=2173829 RepID=A0A401XLL1_9FLAO|nr:hypothetical protein JCM31826_13750 [Thermaurantimonas aggregans]